MEAYSRKEAEREFHNTREKARRESPEDHVTSYPNRRFYATTNLSHDYIQNWLDENCKGKVVLDYCCGTGDVSRQIARTGAEVIGIDISDESIQTCKDEAAKAGLGGRSSFFVMDAENTDFSDSHFDVIVCSGVLHHLDLGSAYKELARIIKPGGKILCVEALAHNPLIQWYRRRTPQLRTEWETEHILSVQDIQRAKHHFDSVEIKYFHLASIAAIPFINTVGFSLVLSALNRVDDILLRIPLINRQAWQAVFTLSAPRKIPSIITSN